jgi:hypothetical protein
MQQENRVFHNVVSKQLYNYTQLYTDHKSLLYYYIFLTYYDNKYIYK